MWVQPDISRNTLNAIYLQSYKQDKNGITNTKINNPIAQKVVFRFNNFFDKSGKKLFTWLQSFVMLLNFLLVSKRSIEMLFVKNDVSVHNVNSCCLRELKLYVTNINFSIKSIHISGHFILVLILLWYVRGHKNVNYSFTGNDKHYS